MPKTVDTMQGRVESIQQTSATPSLHLGFWGLQKIVACSQPYLAVLSCIYSFWHGVISTSYFLFLMIFYLAPSPFTHAYITKRMDADSWASGELIVHQARFSIRSCPYRIFLNVST